MIKYNFLLTLASLVFLCAAANVSAQTATTETVAVTAAPPATANTCALAAPANFSYSKPASTAALLEWSAVSGASAYHLKVYDAASFSVAYEGNETSTSKLVSSLQTAVRYRCELASVCPNKEASANIIIIDIIDR